jgi:hypothetical protein
VPGALEGRGEDPLVLGTGPRLPLGLYLAPVGNVAAQRYGVLIVYVVSLINAEGAYPAAMKESGPSRSSLSGASWPCSQLTVLS